VSHRISEQRLDAMVRGVEFARERTAGNRYIGTLGVVFSAEPVKQWLAEAGISIAETVARAALVVPLWKDKDGLQALDERSAWRDAWSGLDTLGTAVPVAVLRGDQLDQDALSVEQAFVGDVTALARMNERYRAPTVIVATPRATRAGPIKIGGMRYDMQTGARSELPSLTVSDASQLADAARKVHASSTRTGAGLATVRRDQQAGLDVFVPIRALGDWVQVRQRLGSIPAIRTVSVRTWKRPRRAASRLFRQRRAAPEGAGAGRPAVGKGCRQVAPAGAVNRWRFWVGVAAGFLLLLWLLN
jgi:hypothetical protein